MQLGSKKNWLESQDHRETTQYDQISTLGGIFRLGMHRCSLMQLIAMVMFSSQGHTQHFLKTLFAAEASIGGPSSKIIQFAVQLSFFVLELIVFILENIIYI